MDLLLQVPVVSLQRAAVASAFVVEVAHIAEHRDSAVAGLVAFLVLTCLTDALE